MAFLLEKANKQLIVKWKGYRTWKTLEYSDLAAAWPAPGNQPHENAC